MSDGNYYVRAYIDNIYLNTIAAEGKALGYNSDVRLLTLNGFGGYGSFDNINIKVDGSLYDDVW